MKKLLLGLKRDRPLTRNTKAPSSAEACIRNLYGKVTSKDSKFVIYLFEKRLVRLRKLADEQDIEGFFMASELNMRYFTGFSALAIERLAGIVIPVTAKEPVLIVPKLEEEKARTLSFFKDVRSYTDAENPGKLLGKVVGELNLTKGTLGIESFLPFKFYKMLKETAPSLGVKEASDIFQKLRSVKSTEEINLMKRAAKIVSMMSPLLS